MQTQQYNYREKKMKYICNVKDKHMFHFFLQRVVDGFAQISMKCFCIVTLLLISIVLTIVFSIHLNIHRNEVFELLIWLCGEF